MRYDATIRINRHHSPRLVYNAFLMILFCLLPIDFVLYYYRKNKPIEFELTEKKKHNKNETHKYIIKLIISNTLTACAHVVFIKSSNVRA